MKNEINPKANQNNTNTKDDKNISVTSVDGEGTKSQKDNNQPTNKKQDASKNGLNIPWHWIRSLWKWIRNQKLTDWIMALATLAIFFTSFLQWQAIRGQLGVAQKSNVSFR
jgi:hypothetical protein